MKRNAIFGTENEFPESSCHGVRHGAARHHGRRPLHRLPHTTVPLQPSDRERQFAGKLPRGL